jgi:hypothetical protein
MNLTTIILIFLSFVLASVLSFYQYFYKNKTANKVNLLLAFLRFFSIFGILLLLINPKITRNRFEIEKTPLPIVMDNSSSIVDLKAKNIAFNLFEKLTSNSALNDKFEIQTYQFDSEFRLSDNFNFKGNQTNVDEVAKNLKSIYRNKTFPTVLITDGNQTSGDDYVYSFDANNKVYPLVLGDTTTFLDLKINQLNVNKYAFQGNKFPVEVFLNYTGNKNVNANFSISQGNTILNKQTIAFSSLNKSVILNVLLPADKVGLQIFKASITSKESEKNSYNNTKNFAVEVIDQKTNIALISTINHPDVGALKRSIETNAQRKVTIFKPNEIKSLQDYNVLIFYQPTSEFKNVFEANKLAGINAFVITGTNTDFNFLNQNQTNFSFRMSNQKEDYLVDFNAQFNLFALDNIGFEQLPPLQNAFGTITSIGNNNVLLNSRIRNIAINSPLLAFSENAGKRAAYLFGENSWKWRLQSHVDNKSFEKYDIFVDKTIQFLASNNSKKSLVVSHESFYNSGDEIEITSQYFNKNYEFDDKARLTISITNKLTKQTKNYDLLKTNNAFKVNLNGLSAGQYVFSVKELNSNSKYNSYFEILDFDIEKQFVNPDLLKLNQLSTLTIGKTFMPNQVDDLIKTLLQNENYKAIQKSIVKKIPLIDSILLLILIVLALVIEWFVRKYNGML